MKLRLEPISAIVLSIVLGYAWYEIVDEPICIVHEVHNGVTIEVPYKCKDVLTD